MEPASILELTSTVLKLSGKLYNIFKAFRDAPEESREYLTVLESVRRVFQNVQDYAGTYQRSAFFVQDGMRMKVVQSALKDCELEFTFQLSLVESMNPDTGTSLFTKSKDRAKWVFKKENIEGLTRKLEKLQGLLSLAMTTSAGLLLSWNVVTSTNTDTILEQIVSSYERN